MSCCRTRPRAAQRYAAVKQDIVAVTDRKRARREQNHLTERTRSDGLLD